MPNTLTPQETISWAADRFGVPGNWSIGIVNQETPKKPRTVTAKLGREVTIFRRTSKSSRQVAGGIEVQRRRVQCKVGENPRMPVQLGLFYDARQEGTLVADSRASLGHAIRATPPGIRGDCTRRLESRITNVSTVRSDHPRLSTAAYT